MWHPMLSCQPTNQRGGPFTWRGGNAALVKRSGGHFSCPYLFPYAASTRKFLESIEMPEWQSSKASGGAGIGLGERRTIFCYFVLFLSSSRSCRRLALFTDKDHRAEHASTSNSRGHQRECPGRMGIAADRSIGVGSRPTP
ncbi:hypothetical protein R1flu_007031 [Riccia fluitans]|uniref:Uncharacterized protein n=1 Tax=Riccia fluitans TaxID=41844 RepID=A0ABD1YXP3_9MARC